jgi:peptide-methionine (S)-S-oxide reductase
MTEEATFAAGCFWGVEAAFRAVPGVLEVESGYTGGTLENPTYEQVCTDTTGHAEAVHVTYDLEKVSYTDLLNTFFTVHDPTQKDGQGLDMGRQYRSAVFYHNEEQRALAETAIETRQGVLERTIVTEVTPASTFWRAEDYHQNYAAKNRHHC